MQRIFPGAFFYIEGCFYDDDRQPHASKLSRSAITLLVLIFDKSSKVNFSCSCIVDWANQDDVSVGPFTSQSMQEVTFSQLTLRLGQPYLFTHQGNCEHLIVFTDLRFDS